jgi:hypothetical protein
MRHRLPGYIGTALLVALVSAWTLWGVGELYYEGWGLPLQTQLRYLALPLLLFAFALLTITWPGVGGFILVILGSGFSIWWVALAAARGTLSLRWLLTTLSPFAGVVVAIGVLFLLEGRYRRRRRDQGWTRPERWVQRHLGQVLVVGVPLLVASGVSVYYAPLITSRIDDGDRGMRLIEGNGVTLIWAPLGPGWNWRQPWGGYPSWDAIALYGVPPVGLERKLGYEEQHATSADMLATGLCRYLSEDGLSLANEPQEIWRMPTVREVVRSLVSSGESAGCEWDGRRGNADCARQPNKDTPLWAPDMEPIYYWSADERDANRAWYVPYTGGLRYGGLIYHQRKDWGNPRHGYRCVRDGASPIALPLHVPEARSEGYRDAEGQAAVVPNDRHVDDVSFTRR